MDLRYNTPLTITIGSSRFSENWHRCETTWAKFVERCSRTKKTPETMTVYLDMSREQQGEIKDVGGFVGATFSGTRRRKADVICRQLLTLDADEIAPGVDIWARFLDAYNCAALVYGTHKYRPEKPRVRFAIPLSREVNTEEHEAIARAIADKLGMANFDKTTFEAARLMYWPSTPADIDFYFRYNDAPILDPDKILATYNNWQDITEWPTHPQESPEALAANKRKAQDPTGKPGAIGLFCRAYTPAEAITKFLPEIYTPAGAGRFTYSHGSTYGGLQVYGDGYAISHHTTDPANVGHPVNAFDLVRIHNYRHLDTDAQPDTPVNRLPSFKAMEKLVYDDPECKQLQISETLTDFSRIVLDAADGAPEEEDDHAGADMQPDFEPGPWSAGLDMGPNGMKRTTNNLRLILLHDRKLQTVKYDRFAKCDRITGPYFQNESTDKLNDESAGKIALYLERAYNMPISTNKVLEILSTTATERGFNPVHDFIKAEKWDGSPRLETVLIDYLGANDTPLNRAITKLWFVGAVARAFEPGVKFDYVLTLPGPQGIGKSTFLATIAGRWFSDSFSFADKDNKQIEAVIAAWIVEISELNGLKRANDAEGAKAFISRCVDRTRLAYKHTLEDFPRHNVFAATTNEEHFLTGDTGNRRWWIVPVKGAGPVAQWLPRLRTEIPQIWAEAFELYSQGTALYLRPELEAQAKRVQFEYDTAAGDEVSDTIENYLDILLPPDWYTYDKRKRREWINNPDPLDLEGTIKRTVICAAEVLNDLPELERRRVSLNRITRVLKHCKGWELANTRIRIDNIFGRPKTAFVRVDKQPDDDEDDI